MFYLQLSFIKNKKYRIKDEYYQRFRDAINRIKQSDEAKHTLLQKYIPNVLQNYWSNSENHIGSGYYGIRFKNSFLILKNSVQVNENFLTFTKKSFQI